MLSISYKESLVSGAMLMAISFMGYVLPFGQMSFWGATVITNLLSPFPSFRKRFWYLSYKYFIGNLLLYFYPSLSYIFIISIFILLIIL